MVFNLRIPFTQNCFVPNLVENRSLINKRRENVTDRRTDNTRSLIGCLQVAKIQRIVSYSTIWYLVNRTLCLKNKKNKLESVFSQFMNVTIC